MIFANVTKESWQGLFCPHFVCACAIVKSSSSLLILLRVMNSETSKLLERAILGGFIVVDA